METKETLAYKYGYLLGYVEAETREETMFGDSIKITVDTSDGNKLVDHICLDSTSAKYFYSGYEDGQERLMIDTKDKQYNNK